MTWRRAGTSLIVLVLVLGIAGCKGGDSTGPGGSFGVGTGPFVTTGGAEVTFIVDLFTNRMSFNAKGDPATGVFNFQGKMLGFDDDMHGDIICYEIFLTLTGKAARVGGLITRSDLFAPGTEALWTVEDDGEPGSSGLVRDKITVVGASNIAGTAQAFCTGGVLPLGVDPTMYPIETGNVQVHP